MFERFLDSKNVIVIDSYLQKNPLKTSLFIPSDKESPDGLSHKLEVPHHLKLHP
jgi:hypothetical protein